MKFRYFSLDEFACACGCGLGHINPLLVMLLDKVRSEINEPISVRSGIRCKQHNQKIGGRLTSQHLPDIFLVSHAADISCNNLNKLFTCCKDNFLAVGDGRARGYIHVDMRSDKKRRWTY